MESKIKEILVNWSNMYHTLVADCKSMSQSQLLIMVLFDIVN